MFNKSLDVLYNSTLMQTPKFVVLCLNVIFIIMLLHSGAYTGDSNTPFGSENKTIFFFFFFFFCCCLVACERGWWCTCTPYMETRENFWREETKVVGVPPPPPPHTHTHTHTHTHSVTFSGLVRQHGLQQIIKDLPWKNGYATGLHYTWKLQRVHKLLQVSKWKKKNCLIIYFEEGKMRLETFSCFRLLIIYLVTMVYHFHWFF